MPRKRGNVIGTLHHVRVDLIWPTDQYNVIREMARRNGLTIDEMVDEILDDWASMANRDLGNTDVPRRLYIPEIPKPQGEGA